MGSTVATAAYLKPHKALLQQAEQLLLLYTALGLSVEVSYHLPLVGGGSQGSVELQDAGICSLQYSMFENNIAP